MNGKEEEVVPDDVLTTTVANCVKVTLNKLCMHLFIIIFMMYTTSLVPSLPPQLSSLAIFVLQAMIAVEEDWVQG